MPIKIKIFFSFLGLLALFSVLALVNSSKSLFSLSPSPNLLTGTVLEAVEQDADHDGLTNKEESYWNTDFQNPDTDGDGYLDGEEVASGHDPLKPGPDDNLLYGPRSQNAAKSKNITSDLADLITSGFYAGDLKKTATDATYAKAIDSLSLAVIYDGVQALTPDDIKSEEIKTTSNIKTLQEQYVNNIVSIIEKNLLAEILTEPFEASRLLSGLDINNNANNKNITVYFLSKSEHINQIIQKVNALDVPKDWVNLHKALLTFLKDLQINYNSLASTEEDPLKALVAIHQLQTVYLEAQPLFASFAIRVKMANINVSSSEFLNLINNLNAL